MVLTLCQTFLLERFEMKYIVCQSKEEAQNLVEQINQELGYPKVHQLGVDSFIEKPGNAYERLSRPGAIQTPTEILFATSKNEEFIVILNESNKQEITVLQNEIIIDGVVEIKTREEVAVVEVVEEVVKSP